jgi:predicted metalloprotease with PDZ domain
MAFGATALVRNLPSSRLQSTSTLDPRRERGSVRHRAASVDDATYGSNSSSYDVSLKRPLGLTIELFGEALAVVSVKGNAEAAGVIKGDEIIGIGSFFGNSMWSFTGSK